MPSQWRMAAGSRIAEPIKPMQTFLQRVDQHLEKENGSEKHQKSDRLVADPAEDGEILSIAVVGGGVASVEIALCLDQRMRKSKRDRPFEITIFTSSDRIADEMTKSSIRKIESILVQRGVRVKTGRRVTSVGETSLVTEDDVLHHADCIIWATGATAPDVLGKLGLPTDERGFIATRKTLQSVSDERIFAVGDAGTVIDSPSPKAGVYAVRQSPILWHNLRALLNDRGLDHSQLKEFCPQDEFLKLLNTGDGKALLQYHGFSIHARGCGWLKTWIDKRFVAAFQRR